MIKKIYTWFNSLSKRLHDSICISAGAIGTISTAISIMGYSFADIEGLNIWIRILIFVVAAILIGVIAYIAIEKIFKDKIDLNVNNTPVEISCGDIFKTAGWKVIGCDTCFRTQIDDVVISKNSLHGQLVLEHGNADEINKLVEAVAIKMNISKNDDDLYDFPLGTIIPYTSGVDNQTYLMLAMTELNEKYESHTNMAKFESMLMKMWNEISRVYASHDVVLPILGDGISRFDDGPKDKNTLLRCMICTYGSSGISLNSKIKVIIYVDDKKKDNDIKKSNTTQEIPLYELRDVVKTRR